MCGVALEHMLRFFGFHDFWVKWIMACVMKASYSIKVTGHKSGFVQPTRGMRREILYFLICFFFSSNVSFIKLKFPIYRVLKSQVMVLFFFFLQMIQ